MMNKKGIPKKQPMPRHLPGPAVLIAIGAGRAKPPAKKGRKGGK